VKDSDKGGIELMKKNLTLLPILIASLLTPAFGQQAKAFAWTVSEGGYLGVTLRDVTKEDQGNLGISKLTGVLIESVLPDTPAEAAGLQKGDLVLTFDSETVRSARHFQRLVGDTPTGRTVQLSLKRSGSNLSLEVAIGKRAAPDIHYKDFTKELGEAPFYAPDIRVMPRMDDNTFVLISKPRLGIRGEALTEQMAEFLAVPQKSGVLVMEVIEGSAAEKANLQAGDVIVSCDGNATEDIPSLTKYLKDGDHDLSVIRAKKQITIPVTIGAEEKVKKKSKSTSIKM
jgi:serine protease Do